MDINEELISKEVFLVLKSKLSGIEVGWVYYSVI